METDDEEEAVHGRADHRDPAGAGGGRQDGDLARKHGVSEATLYNWKAKFGGMDVSDAKRLKALEDENGKLKRLLADAMLDNTALKDLLSKKW
jgi:putative transposase